MGPSRFCRPHLENCCLARVADSCSRGAFPCSVAYVGFRVWLLRLLVWSRHLCFYRLQSTCQPHHTTLLVSLKTVVVLAHWSSLPEVHRGVYPGALSFFETLADVLLCPARHCSLTQASRALLCFPALEHGAPGSCLEPGSPSPVQCRPGRWLCCLLRVAPPSPWFPAQGPAT